MPNPNAGFLFAFLLLKKSPFYAFFLLSVTPNVNQRFYSTRIIGVAIYATYFTIFPIGANAITAPGSCVGGVSDGRACTSDADCPGGTCVFGGPGGGTIERHCCTINGVVCGAPEGQTCEEACAECYCDPCPEVDADEDWELSLTLPYQSKLIGYVRPSGSCDCMALYHYRCNSGYYGGHPFTGNAISTVEPDCTKCPAPADDLYTDDGTLVLPGTTGTTSPAGSPKITDCYVDTKYSFKDTYGVYQYTSNCNYTE